jgi:hypothetical protein
MYIDLAKFLAKRFRTVGAMRKNVYSSATVNFSLQSAKILSFSSTFNAAARERLVRFRWRLVQIAPYETAEFRPAKNFHFRCWLTRAQLMFKLGQLSFCVFRFLWVPRVSTGHGDVLMLLPLSAARSPLSRSSRASISDERKFLPLATQQFCSNRFIDHCPS